MFEVSHSYIILFLNKRKAACDPRRVYRRAPEIKTAKTEAGADSRGADDSM